MRTSVGMPRSGRGGSQIQILPLRPDNPLPHQTVLIFAELRSLFEVRQLWRQIAPPLSADDPEMENGSHRSLGLEPLL
jgi:hypothetical protein